MSEVVAASGMRRMILAGFGACQAGVDIIVRSIVTSEYRMLLVEYALSLDIGFWYSRCRGSVDMIL